jgi:hypothetical protein
MATDEMRDKGRRPEKPACRRGRSIIFLIAVASDTIALVPGLVLRLDRRTSMKDLFDSVFAISGQSADQIGTAVCELAPGCEAHAEHVAAYGHCTVTGCNYPAYMGRGQLCDNCGHNYDFHALS